MSFLFSTRLSNVDAILFSSLVLLETMFCIEPAKKYLQVSLWSLTELTSYLSDKALKDVGNSWRMRLFESIKRYETYVEVMGASLTNEAVRVDY